VTETLIVNDDSKPTAEPTANLDVWAGRLASEQNAPSVYAAYWQARSGFFDRPPKLTAASIDPARSSRP
jgi:hypothetical protein